MRTRNCLFELCIFISFSPFEYSCPKAGLYINIIYPERDVSVTGEPVLAPVLGKLKIGQGKMHPGTKKHPPDVGGVVEDAVLGMINLSFAGADYFLRPYT